MRDPHPIRTPDDEQRQNQRAAEESVTIIGRRRLTRSTTTPASGPTIATGRNWTIIIHATAVAEPVRSNGSA
jgi:hypothetical protein